MPYNVFKYNLVDDEIENIILYYETISYDLGQKAETEILAALNKLVNHPKNYSI